MARADAITARAVLSDRVDRMQSSACAKPLLVVSDTGRMASDVAAAPARADHLVRTSAPCQPHSAASVRGAIVDVDLRAAKDARALLARALGPGRDADAADRGRRDLAHSRGTCTPPAGSREIILRPTSQQAIADRVQALLSRDGDTPASGADPLMPVRRTEPTEAATGVSAAIRALTDAFADVAAQRPMDLAPFGPASRSFVESLRNAVATDAGLAAFLRTIESYHSATLRHSLSVTANAVLFGIRLELGRTELALIAEAGLLHDIGKAVIPLEVLDKPGRLTEDERALIHAHPSQGERLLRLARRPVAPQIMRVVRHHHEYLNGSGYPDGIKADCIPDLVRLMTVADVFTALVEDRPYKPPMPAEKALDILDDIGRRRAGRSRDRRALRGHGPVHALTGHAADARARPRTPRLDMKNPPRGGRGGGWSDTGVAGTLPATGPHISRYVPSSQTYQT